MSAHQHQHSHGHHGGGHSHQQHQHQQKDACCDKHGGGGCGDESSKPVPISRDFAGLERLSLYQAALGGDVAIFHYVATRPGGESPSQWVRRGASAQMIAAAAADAGEEGETLLHVCARRGNVDIAYYLVQRCGIPVDCENDEGHTPLMIAISFGHLTMSHALISLGASLKKRDSLGFTPLIHASQYGNVFVFHYLLTVSKEIIDDVDNDGHTAFCWACYNGHTDLVKYMLSDISIETHIASLDNKGRTPMHWAASQNHREICDILANCRSCRRCGPGNFTKCPTGTEMMAVNDREGNTPTLCAKIKGHDGLAKLLDGESRGEKVLALPPPAQDKSEYVAQFLSSFLPFIIMMFIVTPYLPLWASILAGLSFIGAHQQQFKWSNKQKTLVPAGMMASSLIGTLWCAYLMELSQGSVLLLLFVEAIMYYNFNMLMILDPGFIQPSNEEFKKALQDAAATGKEPAGYCSKCKIVKPPRSKHCTYCNACTDRHDHHCYWIFNCVGRKNYLRFYVFLFLAALVCLMFDCFALNYLYKEALAHAGGSLSFGGISYVLHYHTNIVFLTSFYCVSFLGIMALFVSHTVLISKDMTSYEMVTRHKCTPGGKALTPSYKRVIQFLQHGSKIFYTVVVEENFNNIHNIHNRNRNGIFNV